MTVRAVRLTYAWHLWPGRHWPSSAAEEAALVADLAARVGDGPRPVVNRAHVTSVLNVLRCGLTVDAVLATAPGIDPACLLAAYERMEALRARSAAAWAAIVADPCMHTLTEFGPTAARVLSVPVYRLAIAAQAVSPETLRSTARQLDAQVRQVGALSLRLEEQLARLVPPSEQGVSLGRRLYNPYQPAVWGDPFYLPARVGTLSPVRASDLLGERESSLPR